MRNLGSKGLAEQGKYLLRIAALGLLVATATGCGGGDGNATKGSTPEAGATPPPTAIPIGGADSDATGIVDDTRKTAEDAMDFLEKVNEWGEIDNSAETQEP